MLIAYDHLSKNRLGKSVAGTIYASNTDMAWVLLAKRLGFAPLSIKINLRATLNVLFRKEFDRKELAKFYKSIGKRMKNGRTLIDGLDHAQEFILDPKLKQAVLTMRQSIMEGNDEYTAMSASGFPERDAYAIRSTAAAGKSAETFIALGQDIERAGAMQREITKIVRMPIIMLVIIYCAFYLITVVAAPAVGRFLQQIAHSTGGGGIPPFASAYYDFVASFNANLTFASFLYALVPVVFFVLVRSRALKRALHHIRLIRDIAERSEMSSLWTSFAMLYEAAVNVEAACHMLAKAARDDEVAGWFRSMAKGIRAGLSTEQSVARAGFPGYVVRGIRAAESSGDMVGGIRDFTNDLALDVETLTGRLTTGLQIGALLFMALAVVGFFMVAYYPIIASILTKF